MFVRSLRRFRFLFSRDQTPTRLPIKSNPRHRTYGDTVTIYVCTYSWRSNLSDGYGRYTNVYRMFFRNRDERKITLRRYRSNERQRTKIDRVCRPSVDKPVVAAVASFRSFCAHLVFTNPTYARN